jgi:hypothetical protein
MMPEASETPVSVAAAAGTVMFVCPSNATPLMLRAVLNFVAENALPESVAPMKVLASTISNLLVPDDAVTLPVTLPARLAVINPALKPPPLFLATTVPMLFADEALMFQVVAVDPSNELPVM